jgi:hypothetical protein
MNIPIQKLLDSGKKKGKLYENSIFIDDVDCDYEIHENNINSQFQDGNVGILGMRVISGTIHLRNKGIDISQKELILKTDDNLVWEILIVKGENNNRDFFFDFGSRLR